VRVVAATRNPSEPHGRRPCHLPDCSYVTDRARGGPELDELSEHRPRESRRAEALSAMVNDSAVKVLGDEILRIIARELVETVRRNVTIDWAVKETARAKLRVMVRRILRKHGYPPDKQEKATLTVLEQAALLGWEVAA
jgi:restriction endonuclease HindI-like protein